MRKIDIFRAQISEPSRDELLSKYFDPGLYPDPLQNFRSRLRQIYRVETKAGSDVNSALSREKQERKRAQKPPVSGKKEVEGSGAHSSTSDRIPSERSTISDNADSSGGGLVVSTQENPTNVMADDLILVVLNNIWRGAIPLSFAPKERPIGLMWETYIALSLTYLTFSRGQRHEYSFGMNRGRTGSHRITAINDGCLRFVFEPRDSEREGYWPRQAACLALEVMHLDTDANLG